MTLGETREAPRVWHTVEVSEACQLNIQLVEPGSNSDNAVCSNQVIYFMLSNRVWNCLTFWITSTRWCCIPWLTVGGAHIFSTTGPMVRRSVVVEVAFFGIYQLKIERQHTEASTFWQDDYLRQPISSCWSWTGFGQLPPSTNNFHHAVCYISSVLHPRQICTRQNTEWGTTRIIPELIFAQEKTFEALFLCPTCPNVVLEKLKRWWGTHGRTISEHEPESKLDQSQHALISLIGAKPAVWKGPVRVGPNQTWGIRSDSLSSEPKQTDTEKTQRLSTHYRAKRKHI